MSMPKNPSGYPTEFAEIADLVPAKETPVTVNMESIQKARHLRGMFYSWKTCLKKTADEIFRGKKNDRELEPGQNALATEYRGLYNAASRIEVGIVEFEDGTADVVFRPRSLNPISLALKAGLEAALGEEAALSDDIPQPGAMFEGLIEDKDRRRKDDPEVEEVKINPYY